MLQIKFCQLLWSVQDLSPSSWQMFTTVLCSKMLINRNLEWWLNNFNGDFFSASILKQLGKTNSQSNIFTATSSVFTKIYSTRARARLFCDCVRLYCFHLRFCVKQLIIWTVFMLRACINTLPNVLYSLGQGFRVHVTPMSQLLEKVFTMASYRIRV